MKLDTLIEYLEDIQAKRGDEVEVKLFTSDSVFSSRISHVGRTEMAEVALHPAERSAAPMPLGLLLLRLRNEQSWNGSDIEVRLQSPEKLRTHRLAAVVNHEDAAVVLTGPRKGRS